MTEIPAYMFYNCTSLRDVIIPSSVTSIGYAAFGACTSLDLYVPDTVTRIGTFAFDGVQHITYHGTAAQDGYTTDWGAASRN
jgi:hypothetical protein